VTRGGSHAIGVGMLAFDCETLGLNEHRNLITVIALFDPSTNTNRVLRFVEYNFEEGRVRYKKDYRDLVTELVDVLDKAEWLCGFNAIAFDIPFIACQFKIPSKTVRLWQDKTFDILRTARCHFKRTFSLNLLWTMNKVEGGGKTGTGLEAITLAETSQWKKLEEYCLQDTLLIHKISTLNTIFCPEGGNWRRANSGRTYNPSAVAQIDTSKFPELSFSIAAASIQ
jgi:hypothetical protein